MATTSSKATTSKASTSAELKDAEYQNLLSGILSHGIEKRRCIVEAFRASMNAVFFRKDLSRLSALMHVMKGLPEESKVKKAIIRFSGGVERDAESGNWKDVPEKACVFSKKEKGVVKWGLVPELYEAAFQLYKVNFQAVDFDCLEMVKAVKGGVTIADIEAIKERLERQSKKGSNIPKLLAAILADLDFYIKVKTDAEFTRRTTAEADADK